MRARRLLGSTHHWSRRLFLRKRFRGSAGVHITHEWCGAANERRDDTRHERELNDFLTEGWSLNRGAVCLPQAGVLRAYKL
jgi:hypothetical protein